MFFASLVIKVCGQMKNRKKTFSLERLTSHHPPTAQRGFCDGKKCNIWVLLPKMKPITVNVSLETLFVLIILSFFSKRKSGKAGAKMWLLTHYSLFHIYFYHKVLFFVWISTQCNPVRGNPNIATVTKARCYANCLTEVSRLIVFVISFLYKWPHHDLYQILSSYMLFYFYSWTRKGIPTLSLRVGYLNEVYLRPPFSKSLNL